MCRTNLLSVVQSVLFDTAKKTTTTKKTQTYHRVDQAVKLVGATILPNYKFIGPWRCVDGAGDWLTEY